MKIEILLFKIHAVKETRRLVPDLVLLFKRAIYEIKASDLQLNFNKF